MKTNSAFLNCGIFLLVMASLSLSAQAQDNDEDGVTDQIESQLLNSLAPVWASLENGSRAPLPLDWAVRHCRLHWHQDRSKGAVRIGDTGNTPLTIPLAFDLISSHRRAGLNYHYRLDFKEGRFRDGDDPSDPMRWANVQAQGRGLYGRVAPLSGPAKHYLVQFFAFFGWNETDTPPGCDAGNHEGDWVGIDLELEGSDLNNPRIYHAVLHNHGRQIFVESPSAFEFVGTRPVIYPERGTQELWPHRSPQGFLSGTVPPCVSVNRVFGQWENDATAPGDIPSFVSMKALAVGLSSVRWST